MPLRHFARYAYAGCKPQALPFVVHDQCFYSRPKTLSQGKGIGGPRLAQYHHKLFPAKAGQHVARAVYPWLQQACKRLQTRISPQMSPGVVHLLEMVHINQHQSQVRFVAHGALELVRKCNIESGAVIDLGEPIGHRQPL